jgi:hypothetical protein
MKLNYSKKIFIASIIILVVIVVLDVVFSDLLFNKIISINNKVRQLDISSQERERELMLKDSIVSTKEEREKLITYFVPAGDAETVEFTKYLEKLALNMGVTQKKSLNYEPVSDLPSSDIVSAIRYKFIISGKWSNVYNFLLAIENLPKVLIINGINLNVSVVEDSATSTKVVGKIWSAEIDFSVVKLK